MTQQILTATILIALTTLIHGVFIAFAAMAMRPFTDRLPGPVRFMRDLLVLILMGLWLMLAHFLEIALWAGAYMHFDIHADFETAVYFSSVCYTTLGLGGLEVPLEWRWLPGANAANGFLLFGMSAAFLLDLSNKLRLNRR